MAQGAPTILDPQQASNPIDSVSFRRCTRCVMDTSEPDIEFDENGHCNYCRDFVVRLENETFVNHPTRNIDVLVDAIRKTGAGKPYDCIIGVSGGVDSSYVAYLVKSKGLRPLAVHLDNGWNSELAVANVQSVLEKLQIDLVTHVIDWEEFRDIQLSFFKASVVNLEIPTDHAINAVLQAMAVKHHVKFVINGGNIRGEGVGPKSWGWNNFDLKHLRAIHARFGTRPFKTFPQLPLWRFGFNTFVRGIRVIPILNFVDYNKLEAQELLQKELGWRPYGGKHYESIFTRFYQGYILPRKFGVDKRKGHLSSLVVAGDMERQKALEILATDPYGEADADTDKAYVLKKFGWTEAEFTAYMLAPVKPHTAYPNSGWFFERAPAVLGRAKKIAMRI